MALLAELAMGNVVRRVLHDVRQEGAPVPEKASDAVDVGLSLQTVLERQKTADFSRQPVTREVRLQP